MHRAKGVRLVRASVLSVCDNDVVITLERRYKFAGFLQCNGGNVEETSNVFSLFIACKNLVVEFEETSNVFSLFIACKNRNSC